MTGMHYIFAVLFMIAAFIFITNEMIFEGLVTVVLTLIYMRVSEIQRKILGQELIGDLYKKMISPLRNKYSAI